MYHLGLFSTRLELREVSVAFDLDPRERWSSFLQDAVMADVAKRGKIATIFCLAKCQEIRQSSYAENLIEQVRHFLKMSIRHDTQVPPAPRYIKIYIGRDKCEILPVILDTSMS
jgi:hypothetical protein